MTKSQPLILINQSEDLWGCDRYLHSQSNQHYVTVDGRFYTSDKNGDPLIPVTTDTEILILKTIDGWKGSLNSYLDINDLVDDGLYQYILNVIPPITQRSDLVQMGEPYSTVKGQFTYTTLKLSEHGWVYAGNCYAGEYSPPVTNVH